MKTKMIEQQQQETIPQELVEKFDNDKQLVTEFLEAGYTQEELQGSEIIHATKYDPLVRLSTGHVAGFWIDSPKEEKWMDNSMVYSRRNNRFF